MTARGPVLQVGRLGIPLGDPPTTCGLHGDQIVDDRCPTCDTPTPCPWCDRPTTVNRSLGGTRGYLVKGVYAGELCSGCAAESREYDAQAEPPDRPEDYL